jgi:hypothetical protein
MQKATYSKYPKINFSPFFSFASSRCWRRYRRHWSLVQQVELRMLLMVEQQGQRVGKPSDAGAWVLETFLGPQLPRLEPWPSLLVQLPLVQMTPL